MTAIDIASFFARKGLLALGTWLVSQGLLCSTESATCTSTTLDQFVNTGFGAVMMFGSVFWGWWRERGQALLTAQFHRLVDHVNAIPVPPPAASDIAKNTVAAAKHVANESVKKSQIETVR